MRKTTEEVNRAVEMLVQAITEQKRNLQMPGVGRYQPKPLKPYLGYDQWAGWLIIVEWFWMKTLAAIKVMPADDAIFLTEGTLRDLLFKITTTIQDEEEYREGGTKHDILALLAKMREILPKPLHRWLHYCATSYDIICTAYALQLKIVFENVFKSELCDLDEIWRGKIQENAEILQIGRTHLQPALPITAGFWLANLHHRYTDTARNAEILVNEIPIKFTGAVGTSASQIALMGEVTNGDEVLAEMLGLPAAKVTTQIAPPEANSRFYHELMLLSGVLGNLGEDTRLLQSPWYGEVTSHSSSSSAMSHKKANPITAENECGLHVDVIAEFMKVAMTLVSDLQRDLRWSSVMRGYAGIAVYTFQQIVSAKRLIKSMIIDAKRCRDNLKEYVALTPAEALHLSLQRLGLPDAHHFVNKTIVPLAQTKGINLFEAMEEHVKSNDSIVSEIWRVLKEGDANLSFLLSPETFIGKAIEIAKSEEENRL